jgi:Domain of unknown function (DUF4405)
MNFKSLSPRKKLIFCLDIVLLVFLLFSLSPSLTNLPAHEVIGFLIFVPVVIHVSIEWRWLVSYIGRFAKTATKRDRFNLALNVLLFLCLILTIVSGLAISQTLLPYFKINAINGDNWRFLHEQVSTVTMVLVGLHLALSFHRILYYFRRKVRSQQPESQKLRIDIKPAFFRILILCLLATLIAVLSYLLLGRPAVGEIYQAKAFIENPPTLFNGTIQLLGQAVLIVAICYVARRWLKVRV